MHDERGNVDPVKASETPVARGSGASKKRPLAMGENTPIQSKKAKSVSAGADMSPVPTFHQQQPSPEARAQHLRTVSHEDSFEAQMAEAPMSDHNHGHDYPQDHQLSRETLAPLDPSLFAYAPGNENSSWASNNYSYPATERPHLYQMQSLEQIASEVLDMNADYQDHSESRPNSKDLGSAHLPHGLPVDAAEAEENVDSGVSLPGSDSAENNGSQARKEDAADMTTEHSTALAAYQAPGPEDVKAAHASHDTQNNSTSSIPLYRPPAPLSQSPEQSRRLPNGVSHGSPPQTNGHQRKSSSMVQPAGLTAGQS